MSLETVEQSLNRFRRQNLHVLVEHKPPSELVSPVDILRTDELGRTYVACVAGQAPHSELVLTDEERRNLVDAPPSKPDGFMNPGPFGFSPENVSLGSHDGR